MLIGTAVAAGLGRIRTASAASKVNIDLGRTPCAAPIYAAAAQGFFSDKGLDATITIPICAGVVRSQ
jgi:ABC-type nitrate/sulfonate/bicarbonate transport system substrate-binding protein